MSNPRLTLRVPSDGLSAFVSVAAGSPVEKADFDRELRDCGIVTGLVAPSFAHISEALADPNFACDEVLVAAGMAAQPGQDAWLELTFSEGIQPGHVREDGSIDYHERDLLKPASRSEVLGWVHPAVPSEAGQRVDGTSIPAPLVRELALELRSGVELGPDLQVRATRDGVILYRSNEFLDVVDHHVHQGPVDLHSGNLRMQGSLSIKGNIQRPFSAVATGDIEIFGNVDSASVRAGGHLHVRGGVRGGEGSAVAAEGDMTLLHAEAAELHCGGQLRIQEAVNSQLSGAQIHATGRLRGGRATAESQVIVKEAGSPNGTDTQLTAGEPLILPVAEAQRVIAALKSERMAQRAGGRCSDRCKGGKLGRVRTEIDTQEVQRLAERARRRETLLATATIQIGIALPGVSIHIGNARLAIDAITKATRYSLDQESSSIHVEKVTH